MVNNQTPIYYFNAVDMTYDQNQNVIMQEENRRVYVQTWIKTFKVSVYVTIFCFYKFLLDFFDRVLRGLQLKEQQYTEGKLPNLLLRQDYRLFLLLVQ